MSGPPLYSGFEGFGANNYDMKQAESLRASLRNSRNRRETIVEVLEREAARDNSKSIAPRLPPPTNNPSTMNLGVKKLQLVFQDLSFTVTLKGTPENSPMTPLASAPPQPSGGLPQSLVPPREQGAASPASSSVTATGTTANTNTTMATTDGTLKKGYYKKVILNHLDGIFEPGRLIAIMGPSGAGKTSLLDALAGNLMGGQITGKVTVNGDDYTGKKIKDISGFVFQDDLLMATMTVKEAIEMSAILRLPKEISKETRANRVEELIKLLNLEGCRNTLIGGAFSKGVSGGERKRTAIAMELISNPPMLFLDEPTTGLDTFTAYTVVRCLSRLAKHGRTVIATIHQPSSEIFGLFDDVLLMADGNIIFLGPCEKSVPYFSRIGYPCPQYANPADYFFMEVLRQYEKDEDSRKSGKTSIISSLRASFRGSGQRPSIETNTLSGQASPATASTKELIAAQRIGTLIDQWLTSPEHQELMQRIESANVQGVSMEVLRKKAPFSTQFRYLFGRAFKNAFRNPYVISAKVGESVFVGVLVGLVFVNSSGSGKTIIEQTRNKSGALYFLALQAFFNSVFSVLIIFYEEKMIVFREYAAGYYDITPYFWTKFLVELPTNIMSPYLMTLIAYYIIGLNPPFSAYLMCATFVCISALAGVSLGTWIAAIFDDLRVILAVTPLILLPLLLFSGIFVSDLPPYFIWIRYVSVIYYSFSGMMINEFSRDFPNCNLPAPQCSGELVLESYGLNDGLPMGVDVAFGLMLWTIYTFGAYFTLAFRTKWKFRNA